MSFGTSKTYKSKTITVHLSFGIRLEAQGVPSFVPPTKHIHRLPTAPLLSPPAKVGAAFPWTVNPTGGVRMDWAKKKPIAAEKKRFGDLSHTKW